MFPPQVAIGELEFPATVVGLSPRSGQDEDGLYLDVKLSATVPNMGSENELPEFLFKDRAARKNLLYTDIALNPEKLENAVVVPVSVRKYLKTDPSKDMARFRSGLELATLFSFCVEPDDGRTVTTQ